MAYRWSLARLAGIANQTRVDTLMAVTRRVRRTFGPRVSPRVGVEKTRRRSVEDPVQNYSRTRILSTVTLGS